MTLMKTHNMANIGAVAVIVGGIMNQSLLMTTIAQLAAILTDKIIDRVGHSPSERHPGIMKRTPITHSIITAPVWAIVIGLLVSWAIDLIVRPATWLPPLSSTFQGGYYFASIPANATTPTVVACIIAATTHLTLDALTESGIYVPHIPNANEPRLFIRWRLAGIRHDDPGLNMSVSIFSLLAYAGYLLYGNPALAETFTSLARSV